MERPVNLNLFTIRFPVTAIASILHRVSGVLLFLSIPFLVWGLNLSLASPDDFAVVQAFLAKPFLKIIIWGLLTALVYHLLAGIRHFIMDYGYAESLQGGRIGAYLIIILTVLYAIGLGIYLW